MVNRYSIPLKYLVNLNPHLNFEFKGKTKIIAVTYLLHLALALVLSLTSVISYAHKRRHSTDHTVKIIRL
jgi:hypothetical protein